MICTFTCLECKTTFYWETDRGATICVHCPECNEHFQFYKNEFMRIPEGKLNVCEN